MTQTIWLLGKHPFQMLKSPFEMFQVFDTHACKSPDGLCVPLTGGEGILYFTDS